MSTPSTDQIIHALVFEDGGRWTTPTITFSIAGPGSTWPDYPHLDNWTEFWGNEPYKPQYATLTDVQADTFRSAMQQWQQLIAKPIVETNDVTNPGEIRVAISDLSSHAGYAYEPPAPGVSTTSMAGDVWLDSQWVGRSLKIGWDLNAGQYPLPNLLHEIGHALGLKHPFEGNFTLPPEFDGYRYTVMSYQWHEETLSFSAGVYNGEPQLFIAGENILPKTPMVFDILAIQSIYGANPNTGAGDSVYKPDVTEPYVSAIYDAGGNDTIDASDQVRPCIIDLTPGSYSSIGIWTADEQLAYWTAKVPAYASDIAHWIESDVERGALYTWHDNLGIAYGTDIENAIGGSGSDSITGNALDNVLQGGAGADTVMAGDGNDTIQGGEGTSYLRGENGNDSITGGSGFDDINGNMGNDTLHGGDGDDWVVGGKDDDIQFGDAGNDVVWGNLGNDTLDGGDGNDQVRGGQGDDTLTGGNGDDFVSGDRGNDTESGGAGADLFHDSQDAGIDKVLDFHLSEGDRVMLDPGTTYTLSQVGADTVIDFGGGNEMILVGVQLSTLNASPGWIFGN